MKAALEVATIIATITKNAAIVECFPPLSPTISPRVTASETSLRLFSYFALEASCFSQKESRRCCCPSDGRHLCLQALARPKTSSQLGADNSNKADFTLSTVAKILWSSKLLIKYPQDSLQVIFVHISTLMSVGRRRLFESPLQHNLCTLYTLWSGNTTHSCDTTVCRLSAT